MGLGTKERQVTNSRSQERQQRPSVGAISVARKWIVPMMCAETDQVYIDATEKLARLVDEFAASERREEREQLANLVRERLTYDQYQQPKFTWHDVEDLVEELNGVRHRS